MKQRYLRVSKILFCLGLLFFCIGTYMTIMQEANSYIGVEKIVLSQNIINVDVGESRMIYGMVSPTNATDLDIIWESSDNEVVMVSNGMITAIKEGKAMIKAMSKDGKESTCEIIVNPAEIVIVDTEEETLPPQTTKTSSDTTVLAHIKLPTYNQGVTGYLLGCEGVSLYMALKGLGYVKDYTLDQFMDTMPKADTPFDGYSGNPKLGHTGENINKRTTIYPEPLAEWASNYASSKDLTGATIEEIKKELSEGHVILAFVTTGWKNPIWKKYPWSTNIKGEIENNHCLCVVGYRSNGDFLVNDCHDGRKDGRRGEYWVNGNLFASIYNARNYAISVF